MLEYSLESEKTELFNKEIISLKEQLSNENKQMIKLDIKVAEKAQNDYKNLFKYPSSDNIIINQNDHKQFKKTYNNYEKLHEFLIIMDYEPYTIHIQNKYLSQELLMKMYCEDYFRYVSVYLTYQSYVNNLECSYVNDASQYIVYNNGKCIVKFIKNLDEYTKYDVRQGPVDLYDHGSLSWWSDHHYDDSNLEYIPESYTHGYNRTYSKSCILYRKIMKREK
jgi:hypothetical protein